MKIIIIGILKFYSNFLSPPFKVLFGHGCRHTPTCSRYTIQAIEKYGTINGTYRGFRRFITCNAFSDKNYYDPA